LEKKVIADIHDKALEIYLAHSKAVQGFTFATRVRDTANRMSKDVWFQGSNYVFTSPYKAGDKHSKTKTIGCEITEHVVLNSSFGMQNGMQITDMLI